jgi:hypothetical protein
MMSNTQNIELKPDLLKPMPSGSAVCFGLGIYLDKAEAREAAREYFFSVIRKVCPELLYALKRDLFPLYEECVQRRPSLRSFWELGQQEPAIAGAVLKWCKQFHLIGQNHQDLWPGSAWDYADRVDTFWPAIRIHDALWGWSRPSVGSVWLNADPPQWPQMSHFRTVSGAQRKLVVPIREPEEFSSEGAYLKHALAAAKRQLRGILARHRSEAEAAGRIESSVKTQPVHFAWLALRQLHGWGSPAIAHWLNHTLGEKVEPDTIRKGIGNAAELTGLIVRPLRRGRPQKIGNPSR